jgi:hypothetical protein
MVQEIVDGANEHGMDILHGDAPEDVVEGMKAKTEGTKSAVFQRMWDEAERMEENSNLSEKRAKRLEAAGAFRVYQPPKGPRRRIDEPVWSSEIHRVKSVDGAWVSDGEKYYLTKEVLPVSSETRVVQKPPARLKANARALLQRFADLGRRFLMSTPERRSTAAAFGKMLLEAGNLREALRLAGIAGGSPVRAIATVFPDLFALKTSAIGGASFIELLAPGE